MKKNKLFSTIIIFPLACALTLGVNVALADPTPTPSPEQQQADAVKSKINNILGPASIDPPQGNSMPTTIDPNAATSPLPTGDLKFEIIPQLIKILLALTGSFSFIVFVYAGIKLIIAQGNEEEVTKFKNILLWSAVGLVFITTAYALVSGIMQLVFK